MTTPDTITLPADGLKSSGTHTAGPWEYSGGGVWGKSPFNARVRLADITFHNSINGIDANANGRLMATSPTMFSYIKARAAAGDAEAENIVEAIYASR